MSDFIFKHQNKEGEIVIMIATNGDVIFGPGFTSIQDSAREFWHCVGEIQQQIFEGKINNTDGKTTIN